MRRGEATMASTTHRILLTADAYSNVSDGDLNVALVVSTGQSLRIHVGDSATPPDADVTDYVRVSGPGTSVHRANVFTVTDLLGGSDLWARAEAKDSEVIAIRGEANLMIGSGE